jgi:hypothetical protein
VHVIEETWLTTGEAAKIAYRDIRTVRRWADTGIIRSRISPGGHRQIALSTLLQAQPAPGRRISSRAPSVPPDEALPQWAAVAGEWCVWKPNPTDSEALLETLLAHVRDLGESLRDVEQAIRTEFHERDEDISNDNHWPPPSPAASMTSAAPGSSSTWEPTPDR